MITTLVVSTLVCAIIWVVRYVRDYRAVTRELRSFPGAAIANPTPPTLAEISYDPRIPLEYRDHAAKLGKRIVAGENPPRDTSALWYSGPLLEDVEPAVPYDGPIKALMSPYEPPRFAVGGIVRGGRPVYLNEYCDYRIATGPRTTLVGAHLSAVKLFLNTTPTGCQHPNPEPVVLTTDEVVAGVCPDCLQPLPPSSVGSEWRP